jgi:hypothetical protein
MTLVNLLLQVRHLNRAMTSSKASSMQAPSRDLNVIQAAQMSSQKESIEVPGTKESDVGIEVPTPPSSLPKGPSQSVK